MCFIANNFVYSRTIERGIITYEDLNLVNLIYVLPMHIPHKSFWVSTANYTQ